MDQPDYLLHIGVGHLDGGESGRWPWGSGDHPYQRLDDFLDSYRRLKSNGLTDNDIAKQWKLSTTEFRQIRSWAREEENKRILADVKKLKSENKSWGEIAKELGKPESTVRSLYERETAEKRVKTEDVTNYLREALKTNKYIDVGAGTERFSGLNVSETRLKTALKQLEEEGYVVESIKVPQATNPQKMTTVTVLTMPGETKGTIWKNRNEIAILTDNEDGAIKKEEKWHYPESIDSSRIFIRYAEDGGKDRDGTIELRRGVEDISLKNGDGEERNYAQVRIAVDGTHYMKGVALYRNDIPEGYDVVYNSKYPEGSPKDKVFKPLKDDPTNPFGSSVREVGGQRWYDDPVTGEKKLSVINKLSEEGDWDEWSRTVSSQLLGKQNYPLVKRQLELTYQEKAEQFDKIKNLTNPIVKKDQLSSFSDDCDKAAEDLKAIAFPRQSCKLLIPITSVKDGEIYAPTYNNGEKVALVRYPHAGPFEIDILTVNNKNEEGIEVLGKSIYGDAVGINHKTAAKLSGADFDGDTVTVIPVNDRVKINAKDSLAGLKDFDPSEAYPHTEGARTMKKGEVQRYMGVTTNLITDMTIKGATEDEIVRAVKHSMVVIDAYKHELDFVQSEKDNGIEELKQKYQARGDGKYGGASTILSRAGSQERINEVKEFKIDDKRMVDPKTGEKILIPTNRTMKKWKENEDGTWTKIDTGEKAQTLTTKMQVTKDARTLISEANGAIENAYANFANQMKALANEARKEYYATPNMVYSPSAAAAYKAEVDELKSKLAVSEKNAPKERKAQLAASVIMEAKRKDNPKLKKSSKEYKKEAARVIAQQRQIVGAKRTPVVITAREWAAIQAGAVHSDTLRRILANANEESVVSLATPRATTKISSATESRIKAMKASGHYTLAEIADAVGLSTSSVTNVLNEGRVKN